MSPCRAAILAQNACAMRIINPSQWRILCTERFFFLLLSLTQSLRGSKINEYFVPDSGVFFNLDSLTPLPLITFVSEYSSRFHLHPVSPYSAKHHIRGYQYLRRAQFEQSSDDSVLYRTIVRPFFTPYTRITVTPSLLNERWIEPHELPWRVGPTGVLDRSRKRDCPPDERHLLRAKS